MNDTTCSWSPEDEEADDNLWVTSCGQYFILEDSSPKDNGMKYCCYCGKVLEEE